MQSLAVLNGIAIAVTDTRQLGAAPTITAIRGCDGYDVSFEYKKAPGKHRSFSIGCGESPHPP